MAQLLLVSLCQFLDILPWREVSNLFFVVFVGETAETTEGAIPLPDIKETLKRKKDTKHMSKLIKIVP